MKFVSILIALAMMTMLMEGCSRYPEDGQTVGQKLDKVIQQSNLVLADAGNSLGASIVKVDYDTASLATAFSERALFATLEMGDAAINASVKTALATDSDLGATNIDVDTRDGVVALRGIAPTEQAGDRAERIARANKSVLQVQNYLSVQQL